jgi:hypothetical protein
MSKICGFKNQNTVNKGRKIFVPYFFYLIIRYFANRQKRQEYNWQQIDMWAFWSSLHTVGRRLLSQ